MRYRVPSHFNWTPSPSLTLRNSTLWLRSIYVLSEQTATFPLYNFNSLIFITEVENVYSAVRTESLYNTDYFAFKSLKWWRSAPLIARCPFESPSCISWQAHVNFQHSLYENSAALGYTSLYQSTRDSVKFPHMAHGGDYKYKIYFIFRRVGRTAISKYKRPYVCPSTWNSSATAGWIFVKFYRAGGVGGGGVGEFCWKFLSKCFGRHQSICLSYRIISFILLP